jgi:hypothetical protein
MIQVTGQLCLKCEGWVSYDKSVEQTCKCESPKFYDYSVGGASKSSKPKENFSDIPMKKIDRSKDVFSRQVSMEERYPLIVRVLKDADKPLSASEICDRYIVGKVMASDPLSTGHILNVLSMASVVRRIETYVGKSIRVKYELP